MTRNPSKKKGRRRKRRNAQKCTYQQWTVASIASWRVSVKNHGKRRKCSQSLGRKVAYHETKI